MWCCPPRPTLRSRRAATTSDSRVGVCPWVPTGGPMCRRWPRQSTTTPCWWWARHRSTRRGWSTRSPLSPPSPPSATSTATSMPAWVGSHCITWLVSVSRWSRGTSLFPGSPACRSICTSSGIRPKVLRSSCIARSNFVPTRRTSPTTGWVACTARRASWAPRAVGRWVRHGQ